MIMARCPACGTVFRATADQLKLREGLVRCGRCRTAFNALSHVVPAAPVPVDAPLTTAPQELPEQVPAADVTREEGEAAASAAEESAQERNTPETQDRDAEAVAIPTYLTAAGQPVDELADAEDLPDRDLVHSPRQAATIAPDSAATQPAVETDVPPRHIIPPQDGVAATETAEADEHQPLESAEEGAVDEQQTQSQSERWTMLGWGSALVLVFALAVLQFLYLYRNDVARTSPAFRPVIESMCVALDCRIELPQRAELIGIEVSDLQPDPQRKERLVLAATLRNRAEFAQAFPYLELTLTDSRDRALARRVFAPDVYLWDRSKQEAGFAANAEQSVRLVIDTSGVGASGYRLYIFYP